MERRPAKELLHIQGWLDRIDEIVERGKDAYLADHLLQEAGDSLMMKLGEACEPIVQTRGTRARRRGLGVRGGEPELPDPSVRRDQRELTWLTLSRDLPEWKRSLETLFDAAEATISEESDGD